jgi:hypothetical protein
MTEKLTREQIEERLRKRAKKVRGEVKKIEESMVVTNKTMNLRFHPPGKCKTNQ